MSRPNSLPLQGKNWLIGPKIYDPSLAISVWRAMPYFIQRTTSYLQGKLHGARAREGGRERGREGGREEGREGGRERGREGELCRGLDSG